MTDEILINATSVQTRVALVESGVLQEVWVERRSHKGLVGNIYRGSGLVRLYVFTPISRAST